MSDESQIQHTKFVISILCPKKKKMFQPNLYMNICKNCAFGALVDMFICFKFILNLSRCLVPI